MMLIFKIKILNYHFLVLINDYLTRVPFRWSLAENWKTLSVLDVVAPIYQMNRKWQSELFYF